MTAFLNVYLDGILAAPFLHFDDEGAGREFLFGKSAVVVFVEVFNHGLGPLDRVAAFAPTLAFTFRFFSLGQADGQSGHEGACHYEEFFHQFYISCWS